MIKQMRAHVALDGRDINWHALVPVSLWSHGELLHPDAPLTFGNGDESFTLLDPSKLNVDTSASAVVVIGPFGQAGYPIEAQRPPTESDLALKVNGVPLGRVSYAETAWAIADSSFFVYAAFESLADHDSLPDDFGDSQVAVAVATVTRVTPVAIRAHYLELLERDAHLLMDTTQDDEERAVGQTVLGVVSLLRKRADSFEPRDPVRDAALNLARVLGEELLDTVTGGRVRRIGQACLQLATAWWAT